MNSFTNYIEYGKGRGLIYFLVVSIFLAVIYGVSINYSLQIAVKDEAVVNFIDRVPAFSIQDGQVVKPLNSYIVVPFEHGGQDGFILDTTNTPTDQLMFTNGVYVTQNKVYFKTLDKIHEESLAGIKNLEITPDKLRALLSKLIMAVASLFALFLFGILWAGYGILYLVVKLFFLILGRTTCPYIRGRSVFVAWSSILVLDFVLFALGYGFSVPTAFLLALMLAIFIVFRTPLHSMDVEESLQALGNSSSQDNLDFLDRELAKKTGYQKSSDATEKALAQLAREQEEEDSTLKSAAITKKTSQRTGAKTATKKIALKNTKAKTPLKMQTEKTESNFRDKAAKHIADAKQKAVKKRTAKK